MNQIAGKLQLSAPGGREHLLELVVDISLCRLAISFSPLAVVFGEPHCHVFDRGTQRAGCTGRQGIAKTLHELVDKFEFADCRPISVALSPTGPWREPYGERFREILV